uniref:PKP93L n=1 Tax=African swine fever virus TaxID=10497 RepID=A0A6G7KTL6_ASF
MFFFGFLSATMCYWTSHRTTDYSYIVLSILVIILIWYLILICCRSKKNVVINNMPPSPPPYNRKYKAARLPIRWIKITHKMVII